ncbi:MAG: Ig-like domain-containing protein [Thermoanaerobaculia bacterium]
MSLLPVAGCDKATPVAPSGTILTINANPTQIALNGRSTITVVGRKPDGNPLNPGTEIRLMAERGTIDSIVTTDSNGTATTVFHADGRAGAVKISAATGGGDAKAETSVQVGQATDQKPTVLITVSPNNILIKETATVTLIVRNADGTSVGAGQTVIVTSTLGTITDPRPKTKADGTATTMLQAGAQAGTATVSAVFGSSDAAKQDVTIRDAAATLKLTANPASISNQGGTVKLTATAFNSQGQGIQGVLVTFNASSGTLDNTQGVTDANGQVTVTLTLTSTNLSGVCSVDVTASTANLSAMQKIKVTGNSGCPP